MKYYRIEVYTCYCGENATAYMAIPDDEELEMPKNLAIIDDVVDTNAMEWWDEQSEEEFDGDYDAYRCECGYDAYEVSQEEYEENKEYHV